MSFASHATCHSANSFLLLPSPNNRLLCVDWRQKGRNFYFNFRERVYNFVARAARGSREDRKTTAISLWS